MFRFKTQHLKFTPKEGDEVIVKGKITLYEARGDYQMLCDYMEPSGLGNLQQKLNRLIEKLQAQGLFSQANKKAIPSLPHQIGVITSPTGAAIHDVLNVLKRRCPMVPVIIYPTQVQGENAAQEIISTLKLAESRNECDILLITRGGGSLEDLWCFNNEDLALQIAKTQIPIVAAIGHEVDTTITELVADLRAPTPSAAAELIVPEQDILQQKLDLVSLSMVNLVADQIEKQQTTLNIARLKLSDPANAISSNQHALDVLSQRLLFVGSQQIQRYQRELDQKQHQLSQFNPLSQLQKKQQKLDELKSRMLTQWQKNIEKYNHRLQINAQKLNTLSPLSTLSRGYSIVRERHTGKVVTQAKQLSKGTKVNLLMKDGEAKAVID